MNQTLHDQLEKRHMLVRAAFIGKGTSLHAWCQDQGIHHQNASKALLGNWTGQKASRLVSKILDEAGVTDEC